MDITFDAADTQSIAYTFSQASRTWPHNVAVGAGMLIVGAVFDNIGGADTALGCTFNGVAMVDLITPFQDNGGRWMHLYGLVNPDAGIHNIVLSATGTVAVLSGTSCSYFATDITQPDGTANAKTAGSSVTASLTTTLDRSWFVALFISNLGDGVAGSGVTFRNGGLMSSSGICMGDSNGPLTPAGSHNVSMTAASGYQLAIITVGLARVQSTNPDPGAFLSFF